MGCRSFTRREVLLAGYAPFHSEFTAAMLGPAYMASYVLRFADSIGVRYAIVLHHGLRLDGPAGERGEFWCPEAQFTRNGLRFNVEILHKRETLEEIEAFVLELWRAMRLDYAEGPNGVLSHPQPLRH